MTYQIMKRKKVRKLAHKTGLPVRGALVRGGTHRVTLIFGDGGRATCDHSGRDLDIEQFPRPIVQVYKPAYFGE